MILLTGGARSGKSTAAVSIADRWAGPVVYVATAEPVDEEMSDRIEQHRRSRPPAWRLIEEPRDLEGAIARTDDGDLVIIDCLTLWISNLLEDHDDTEIAEFARSASSQVAQRTGPSIVVTNEVGSGTVPMSPLGRRFRDMQGRVNAIWAQRSERCFLVVAGRALELEDLPDVLG